jgi:hypothetical protein
MLAVLYKHVQTNRTEVLRLALFNLRRDLGMLKDDVVDLHERIARDHGDHAKLVFTVAAIHPAGVELRIGGQPRDDLRVNLLYVAAGFVDDSGVDHLEVPPEGTIVMKDLDTRATYTIGAIRLRESARKTVPLRALGELRQGVNDDRTAEERRRDIEMSAWLRRVIREHRGLPEVDDDELEDSWPAANRGSSSSRPSRGMAGSSSTATPTKTSSGCDVPVVRACVRPCELVDTGEWRGSTP